MKKSVILSSLFIFVAAVAYAEVIYNGMVLCLGGCSNPQTVDYPMTTEEVTLGCIVQSVIVNGEAKVFDVNCPDGITKYENAGVVAQDILAVPVGQEADRARQSFNSYAFTSPTCADGYNRGSTAEGYIYSIETAPDPSQSNVKLTMYKRAGCSTFANNTSLRAIGDLTQGSGSVDMTTTNNLLTDIKAGIDRFNNRTGLSSSVSVNVNTAGIESRLDTLNSYFDISTPVPGVDNNAYDTTLGTVEEKDLTGLLTSLADSNPLVMVAQNTHIEVVDAVCRLGPVNVYGRDIYLDFCPLESYIDTFGNILVGLVALRSVFIVFGVS